MGKNFFNLPQVIIDTHCHGRDMGHAYKTTLAQTIKEAKEAGIAISFFMPNIPIINIRQLTCYFLLMHDAQQINQIPHNQYLYFGATDSNLKACEKALEFNFVIGIKIYPKLIESKEDYEKLGVSEDENIIKLMSIAKDKNKPIAAHCSNAAIADKEGHSIRAELADVKKIIRLAKWVSGVKIVICHVSCLQSAGLILKAQEEGMDIAIELTPQHLWFSNDGIRYARGIHWNYYNMINPIRSRRQTEFLHTLIQSDNPKIFIGSDTACHTKEEKLAGIPGIPSNQELVPVMITLAKQLNISEKRIAELISFNAADFFNLDVPRELIETEIKFKEDTLTYNNGRVTNPWNQTKLWFPKY